MEGLLWARPGRIVSALLGSYTRRPEKYYYTHARDLIRTQSLLVFRIASKHLLATSSVIIAYGRIHGRLLRFY